MIRTVLHVTGTEQPWREGEGEQPPPRPPAGQCLCVASLNRKDLLIGSYLLFTARLFFSPQKDKINNNI